MAHFAGSAPPLLLALALLILGMRAQPAVQWVAPAGSARDDRPDDIALTPSGEVLVVGNFDYEDTIQPEMVLHRFDLNGGLVASQPSRGEQIRSVAMDSTGNYYVTGRVWDADRLGTGVLNDFYLAKYSSNGTLLWERTTGSTGSQRRFAFDGGFKVALDPEGNVCVAGLSSGPALFGTAAFPDTPGGPLICKYTPDGTLVWVRRAECTGRVFMGTQLGAGSVRSMAVDRDGNIAIDGYLRSGPADFGGTVVNIPGPDGSFFIARFNTAGEFQWVRTGYGDGGVAFDTRGNLYFNGGQPDPYTMRCGKLGPAGDLLWLRAIPGAYGNGVTLDGGEEPVFTGEFGGTVRLDEHTVSNTYSGALICKSDSTGRFRWAIGATGELNTGVQLLVFDPAGNIYAAGSMSCRYSNGGWICGTGQLGSFTLTQQFEGGSDFFVTKMFDPPAVELMIAGAGSALSLSWSAKATNHVLEATPSLPAVSWTMVTNTPTVTATNRSLELPLGGAARFFRLRKP